MNGATRVWIFNVAIASGALAFYLTAVREMPALHAPHRVPWWVFALLFAVAEISVVHIQFRRDAHSFSLSEVALVLGLFFATPTGLVAAQLIGAGLALAVHRRQSLLKLVFNLANFFLQATIAISLFHVFVAANEPLGPRAWSGAMAATSASSLVSVLTIFIAIALSQGKPELGHLPRAVSFGLVVTITNTSLGLVGATVIWVNPLAVALLAIPTATLFVAYRAYAVEREKHDSLEFLYESTRTLHQSSEDEPDLGTLLGQTRKMFRAEYAEIRAFPQGETDAITRTWMGPGDSELNEETVDLRNIAPFGRMPDHAQLLNHSADFDKLRSQFPDLTIKDAMISPLRGETRVIGSLLVVNRMGDVSSFDQDDLQLFETLANHISVTLEKGRLERSLAQVTQLKEQLKYQAFHDPLTGLANRLLFTDRVEHAVARGGHPPSPLSILFVDLDDFKRVNDSLGHAAGDELLRAAASRILNAVRPGDTAARLGGDEFAALLEGTSRDEAALVAERILDSLAAPFHVGGKEIIVRASLGIAEGLQGIAKAEELLRNADVAMYVAKREGKARAVIFEQSMLAVVVERMEIEADLRKAINGDRLEVHYQPLADLRSGKLTGVEALARWRHPQRGLLPPGEFIPLAEDAGLIAALEESVMRNACAQVEAWNAALPEKDRLTLNINVSAHHLHKPTLVPTLARVLRETGYPPELLQLEITESVMMQDMDTVVMTLGAIKNLGVRIAIDDFGTGYSSLSYLKQFPVDMLKIDRSFVDGLSKGPEEAALAKAVIHIAQALSLQTVAEGIENQDQLQRLRALGCDVGQGHLIGRPADAREMEERLSLSVPA